MLEKLRMCCYLSVETECCLRRYVLHKIGIKLNNHLNKSALLDKEIPGILLKCAPRYVWVGQGYSLQYCLRSVSFLSDTFQCSASWLL